VKYPVVSSLRHKGKTIELDATREIITLIGINGEPMGNFSRTENPPCPGKPEPNLA
jgi:type IV pilus assembly protein PilZ